MPYPADICAELMADLDREVMADYEREQAEEHAAFLTSCMQGEDMLPLTVT
jgi:hypothetical protein